MTLPIEREPSPRDVEIKYPTGRWEPMGTLRDFILSIMSKGKRGKYITCLTKADSVMAYELWDFLFHNNIPPTERHFTQEYSGFEVWDIRVMGEEYKLIAEYLYINHCFDKPHVSIGIAKGRIINLYKVK